ncbi:ATP-dependent DNA helicase RecG [bacterium BMS3Abin07]|nr:ATP-dependent DNA helicase RecG [bacterium BMS3Abin07]GBE31968.1 ATP-dependent DNA helicase RecG [bacterium BMS3Bbin05]
MPIGSLSDSVQYLKGVGPQRAKLLKKLGITSVEDSLYYLPYRYEDRSSIKNISRLAVNQRVSVRGRIASLELINVRNRKFSIFELTLTDGTGIVKAKWFNQPFMKKIFKRGQELFLNGIVKINKYHGVGYEMESPEYEFITDNADSFIHTTRIVPFYRTTSGLGQKTLRTIMYAVLHESLSIIHEFMPDDILERNALVRLDKAVMNAHFPETEGAGIESLNSGRSEFHRRLAFDELFIFQLGVAGIKRSISERRGISFVSRPSLTTNLIDSLPFKLTASQQKVMSDIFNDMEDSGPMNRLLQGDVGSGKTVVAVLAMLKAVECGYQAVLMVPTEILAQQHYFNITCLLKDINVNCMLVTSRTKEGNGSPDILIGTHALIQEGVAFDRLGLVVIDEQHRFGVRQRALLRKKGRNPDVLVMTATPIPRTLAMTLYGDLDHSRINELPPGRTPVETHVITESEKQKLYDLIKREVMSGGQVYVVYPLIEEDGNDALHSAELGCKALKQQLPEFRIGLVHGKMKPENRQEVMDDFNSGKIDILVSTTVIEVGVDVPNANVMIIVHAERFGLSQLHQLRGRVGRGKRKSFCVLLVYGNIAEVAEKRLMAMEKISDGFRIAEEDLMIRGPGDFFGTAQSGFPELRVADIIRDSHILEIAKKEASALLDRDPLLEKCPGLRSRVNSMWKGRVEFYKTV